MILRLIFLLWATSGSLSAAHPNILWIVSEDNGPQLGCYGDRFAHTPHLDRQSKTFEPGASAGRTNEAISSAGEFVQPKL